MPVATLVVAPLVISGSLSLQPRLGAGASGRLAAVPAAIAVALLAVGSELGASATTTMALSTAAHVPAQVGLGLVFATALGRGHGLTASLVTGAVTFAAASLCLALLPIPLALALAPLTLLTVRHRQSTPPAERGAVPARVPAPGATEMLASGAAALVLVLAVTTVARAAGPTLAGALGAFPAVSAVLAVATSRRAGPAAAALVLRGMVRGMPAYLAFCLGVAAAALACGTGAAIVVGLLAASVVATLDRSGPALAAAGPMPAPAG